MIHRSNNVPFLGPVGAMVKLSNYCSSMWQVLSRHVPSQKFIKQQPLLDFCKRCNGHHSPKKCSRAPSCRNWGSINHNEDVCMAPIKFKNCWGPHRSDSQKCLARPTQTGQPTKEQLQAIRKAGDPELQAVARAKAAERKAAAKEENREVPNTQPEVVIIDSEQVLSVEAPTVDAIRLWRATKGTIVSPKLSNLCQLTWEEEG